MSVYVSQDPFGMSSGFMSKEPESVEAVRKELEAIAKSAHEREPSSYQTKLQQDYQDTATPVDHWNEYGQVDMLSPEMQLGIQLSLAQKEACEREEERLKAKQMAKYGYGSDLYKSEVKALREAQEQQYGASFGYRDLSKRPKHTSQSLYTAPRESYEDRRLRMPKPDPQVPDLGKAGSRAGSIIDSILPPLRHSISAPKTTADSSTVKLTLTLKYESYAAQELTVEMHKSRDVSDLYDRTETWLTQCFNYQPGAGRGINLLYRNRVLDRKKTLKESEVTEDAKVFVQLIDEPKAREESKAIKTVDEKRTDTNPEKPASQQLPKEPRPGYSVSPPMEELRAMSLAELQAVDGLAVANEYGSVQFLGKTDVTGCDLAELIEITRGSCEVYDEQHKDSKPPVGQKLNRPATITLLQVRPKAKETGEQREAKLRKALDANGGGAEHLSYDAERFIWQFKVPHFTKWGQDDSDDEDEQQTNTEDPADPKQQKV